MSLCFFLWQLSLVKLAWPAFMAKLYISVLISLDFFGPFHSIHFVLTYFTDSRILSIADMDNEANTTTDAASDLNPNGFITNRELGGERRSIRHYNDGRVSGRGRSVEGSLRTRMQKKYTRAGGRGRPPTSHPCGLSGGSTPTVASGPSDIADITAAMAKLNVDHPTSLKVKKLGKKLKLDADSGIETVALRKVAFSSTASVASSTGSTGSRSSVNARIAEIESRVKKHIKTQLHSITEEEEEEE